LPSPPPGSRGALLLPSPLRTARKPFGLCRSSLSQGPLRDPVGQAPHLHDTGPGLTSATRRRPHQQASCRHLLCLPSQLFRRSRAKTPEGSQPVFAGGDLSRRLNPYPSHYGAAFASSLLLYPPSHRRPPRGGPTRPKPNTRVTKGKLRGRHFAEWAFCKVQGRYFAAHDTVVGFGPEKHELDLRPRFYRVVPSRNSSPRG
jgi:hypothetical protein